MNLLPDCYPSEEELYQQAVSEPLEVKIEKALAFLRGNEILHGGAGYYLAFSGGKDSITIHRLAEMAGVKFDPWYNNVTIDPPELVRFIQKKYPHVRWNQPKKNLIAHMADSETAPPTRFMRWCCELYKEQGGTGRAKILGVRAPESVKRKLNWRATNPNRNGGMILCPILYWTDADVWTFIKQENISYCELYDQGFKRLGCIGCPMGGKKGRERDFQKWPQYKKLWEEGFRKMFSRLKGVPTRYGKPRTMERFNSWQEWFSHWIEVEPEAEECQSSGLFT